ncbi:hypothetical protein [Cellulomonas sp. NPDC089187]|uniref:hypothetical protein n=1 Tax=Cellulomonas sp. NPDC089187 TaxID=3154970 RepID=UPI003442E3EC
MTGALAGLSRGLKIFLVVDLVLIVVLAVTAILLLGGGGDDPTPQAGTPTSSTATSSSEPTRSASDDVATSDTEQRFASPTGNIVCDMTGEGVTCTIANTSVEPPAIAGCTGAGTGHVITLTTGGVDVPCTEQVPDAAGGDVEVLEYGSSQQVGEYTCTSGSDGMSCTGADGVGFRVATAERVELP